MTARDLLARTDRLIWQHAHRWAAACRSDAEEVAQQFRLAVLEKFPTYDPARGAPTTWVSRVCETTALNAIRSGRVRDRVRVARLDGSTPDRRPTAAPDHAFDRDDVIRRVRAAVAALAARDRELVTRRFGLDGGRPAKLKALRGGLSVQRAQQRVAAALSKLRHDLSGL